MAGSQPIIAKPGGGRKIDIGDSAFGMYVKATGDQTEGVFSLLESIEPPDLSPPLHIHHDASESFYILEGEYEMFVAGERYLCAPGSFVHIPSGVPHTFKVGAIAGRKLNLYTPAAMVGYFDDLAAAAAEGADDEAISRIALRYNMEVVGPVPDNYV
jgi:mannose-6-phosphate isomerase-like protein (cupin superfamily)